MFVDLVELSGEIDRPVVNVDGLHEFSIPRELALKLEVGLALDGLVVNRFTSHINTSESNYAIFPNQYFSLSCLFYHFAFELIKYFEIIKKLKVDSFNFSLLLWN